MFHSHKQQADQLRDDCIKCLDEAMIMLKSKTKSLAEELYKINDKGENMTGDDVQNRDLINTKGFLLDQIYRTVLSTKDQIAKHKIGKTLSQSDLNDAKDTYSSYMKALVDAINLAKTEPEWQDVAKHRGFLGVIDKVLQLILGEWAKVKTSSERVADNVASKIDNARPTK